MKVRFTDNPTTTGHASKFNMHAIAEVIVGFDEGNMDTCFIKDLEVEIDGEWISLQEAFRENKVITDNYNTTFFEPPTSEDKERGFTFA